MSNSKYKLSARWEDNGTPRSVNPFTRVIRNQNNASAIMILEKLRTGSVTVILICAICVGNELVAT